MISEEAKVCILGPEITVPLLEENMLELLRILSLNMSSNHNEYLPIKKVKFRIHMDFQCCTLIIQRE